MKRSLVLLAVTVLAGCQDYQFVKVGRCLLQPGTASVGSASAVDILFVVDDSQSMDKFQTRLGENFNKFISRVAQKQQARVAGGKTPFDIHIAVTTTSVLENRYNLTAGVTAGECNASNVCEIGGYSCAQGDHCAQITTVYRNVGNSNCTAGIARANGVPYPAGGFTAAGTNPTVLSFTKDLKWGSAANDPTIGALIEQFKANVKVGSCGANQEMPFEAARLAIRAGLAKQQGVEWPHENSKIAVIFVSNEDDCSAKAANLGGLVWVSQGAESCRADVAGPATASRLIPNDEYVRFLTGETEQGLRGRPLSVAFVRPGDFGGTNPCMTDPDPEIRTDAPGIRTADLASKLRKVEGVNTLEASVCGDFAMTLEQIADSLPPPDHIKLPTIPAEAGIVRLQIVDDKGALVRVCAEKTEWYFVNCQNDTQRAETSQCVKIEATSACAPQPGETLQAEYLGRVPQEGCRAPADCTRALGGRDSDWTCNAQGSCECAPSQSGH